MEDFCVELAGVPLRIRCRYRENRTFFDGYLTEKKPSIIIEPDDGIVNYIHDGLKQLDETEGYTESEYAEWFLENNAIHFLAADKLIEHSVLMLHGSALALDGEGIIFSAKSGTGKSTHAKLWREKFGDRVQMINDDKPMIRVDEMKVYGTPWDGKHHLSSNVSVPLKAIVKLDRAEKNRIEPLEVKLAMKLLMEQTYVSKNPEKTVRVLELFARLIEKVPFYWLECNMNPEAAQVAWEEIIGPKDALEYIESLRLHNKGQSYDKVMKFLEAKARKMNVPLFGQFELTPLCNLDCRMCYVHLSRAGMQGCELLAAEKWKDIIKQAFSAGMMEAALTGGECLTYPGFDDIFLFLQSLGCQVTVMTNGVLLDEKRMEFFTNHPPALIQVTLYGNNEDAYERVTGHRVFGRVLENLKRVRECGIALCISITATSLLGEDIFDTLRLARSLTDQVIISTALFAPQGEEWRLSKCRELDDEFVARIRRYDNEIRGIKLKEIPEGLLPTPGGKNTECSECGLECGGGRSGFVISWKGEMRICNRMEARSYPLRDGFSAAWKEINHIANSWPKVAECNGCAYEDVCTKCAAQFAQYAEPGKRPEKYCEKIRYWVSKGVLSMPEC